MQTQGDRGRKPIGAHVLLPYIQGSSRGTEEGSVCLFASCFDASMLLSCLSVMFILCHCNLLFALQQAAHN